MPITAKLSSKFYERLGDDVANELVEWLNLVDTSYRQEFRELFEANFGRLEARMATADERVSGFKEVMEARFGALDERIVALEARMGSQLQQMKAELLKWTLVFWLGTMGTVLAMLKL